MITVLKSKLQKVFVTESKKEYEGSITLDLDLMEAAKFVEYEQVHVNGLNGNRIITYVLKGERGSGTVCMNGGAAKHFKVGDGVHVLSYKTIPDYWKPETIIIHTDKNNKINATI